MAAFTPEVAQLTSKLIQLITGFQPDEENFQLCYQFCESNIKYHRYLNVDSLKVKRRIQNLSIKFKVHSLPEQSDMLEKKTALFLDLTLEKSFPKSDAHYAVLLFLICISHSPTHIYNQLPQSTHFNYFVSTPTDKFDWKSYLLEGISFLSYDSSSEDDNFSFEEDSSPSTPPPISPCINNDSFHDSAVELSQNDENMIELTGHVTSPYWQSSSGHFNLQFNKHYACNLAMNWLHYQRQQVLMDNLLKVEISEIQAVRESIWILLGVQSSYLYVVNEGVITVQDNIIISHLTPSAFHKITNEFAELATKLMSLRRVVMVTQDAMVGKNKCTQTSQAFSDALMQYLSVIDNKLHNIEKTIIKQQDFISLIKLSQIFLSEVTIEVSCLVDIIGDHDNTNQMATILLDKLWTALDYYDTLGIAGKSVVAVLFPLFMMTLQPYMRQLEKWMTCGEIHDPFDEFYIKYNSESKMGNSLYWQQCYYYTSVPKCLQSVAHQVLVAGKSCHLTEAITTKRTLMRNGISLSDNFLSHFITLQNNETPTVSIVTTASPYKACQLVLLATDPVLCQAVTMSQSYINDDKSFKLWQQLCTATSELNGPLTTIINKCLETTLHDHFIQSSKRLTDLLKEDFDLLKHFSNLQDILLMAAGDSVHQFAINLFDKMQDGEPITESSFITTTLHEALQERHSHLENLFTVKVSSPVTANISTLSNITILYNVPWPINLMFPNYLLLLYNNVFTFLLQVKYARWALDQIWCKIKYADRISPIIHKLSLLRAKLLHFVVSISHYLLTRILHSSGLEFESTVSITSDLDSLISSHDNYITTINDRCLLNKKAQYVKEAVMKILSLVLTFYHQCSNLEQFKLADAQSIEDEFSRCSHFLISCLLSHIKRGSFPHLETLAFSLSSLLSGHKIFS